MRTGVVVMRLSVAWARPRARPPISTPPESFERNVGAEDRPQRWSWRDYRFTIDAHAYDEWMQLTIERLELEPIF